MSRISILLAFLAGGCATHADRAPERKTAVAAPRMPKLVAIQHPRADSALCRRLRPSDSLATSREGFLAEVLDARATHRTPRFDSYHDDSYGVDKQEVATGLVDVSRACGLPLRAVVIVGPVGVLWAYYVLAFLDETPATIRVNSLVMPHARITDKSSGVITVAAFDSLLGGLTANPVLEPGQSHRVATTDTSQLGKEFSYDLLVLKVIGDSTAQWNADLMKNKDTTAAHVLDPLNKVLEQLKVTYPTATLGPRQGRTK